MSSLTLRRAGVDVLVIPLSAARKVVGRGDDCDHQIPDPAVSRHQFAIELRGASAFLMNLAAGGTTVSGNAVTGEVRLEDGDQITLGQLTARFQATAQRASSALTQVGSGGTLALPGRNSVPLETAILLSISRHGEEPRVFGPVTGEVSIGTAPDNQICLRDRTVSAHHARLVRTISGLKIQDVGARNGIRLDGVWVESGWVRGGSTITLGETEIVASFCEPHGSAVSVLPGITGASEPMREAARLVLKVAPSAATVVLTGETGTGKTHFARVIHARSSRSEGPFVHVDCTQLEGQLGQSEIFGHEKGAFTGADKQRQGAFERADGGTIFLDEIGELSPEMQMKLLWVLQEKCFTRVGGNEVIKVDVRVICATHRDLEEMVEEGSFREDLLHRLHTVEIEVPPLRARGEDVIHIAEDYLRARAPREGRVQLSDEAKKLLRAHPFPGNVRELEKALERALVMREGPSIEPADLALKAPPAQSRPKGPELRLKAGKPFNEYTREIALWVLEQHRGNKTKAAEALRIARDTFKRHLSPEAD